jgi:hypothetical protein
VVQYPLKITLVDTISDINVLFVASCSDLVGLSLYPQSLKISTKGSFIGDSELSKPFPEVVFSPGSHVHALAKQQAFRGLVQPAEGLFKSATAATPSTFIIAACEALQAVLGFINSEEGTQGMEGTKGRLKRDHAAKERLYVGRRAGGKFVLKTEWAKLQPGGQQEQAAATAAETLLEQATAAEVQAEQVVVEDHDALVDAALIEMATAFAAAAAKVAAAVAEEVATASATTGAATATTGVAAAAGAGAAGSTTVAGAAGSTAVAATAAGPPEIQPYEEIIDDGAVEESDGGEPSSYLETVGYEIDDETATGLDADVDVLEPSNDDMLQPDDVLDGIAKEADDTGEQANTRAQHLQRLAAKAGVLLAGIKPVLEAVFLTSRIAASKMLVMRLQDLMHHTSAAVVRIPVSTVSAKDTRLLIGACLRKVQAGLTGIEGSVSVQAYDGESTTIRLGEVEDQPTTIKQPAASTVAMYRHGADSFFTRVRAGLHIHLTGAIGVVQAKQLKVVLAKHLTEVMHPHPRSSSSSYEPSAGGGDTPPPPKDCGEEAAKQYLAGEIRPEQMRSMMAHVKALLAAEAGGRSTGEETAGSSTGEDTTGQGRAGSVKGKKSGGKGKASGGPADFARMTKDIYAQDAAAWAEFVTRDVFGGVVPSVDQALLLFRIVHSVDNSEVKPTVLGDVLAQAAFDKQRMDLMSQQGPPGSATGPRDFFSKVYCAAQSPDTGGMLFDHENYVHKLKNMISQLRNQSATDERKPLLLSKVRILSAVAQAATRGNASLAL